MFRASTEEEASRVVVAIDGQLTGEYVDFVDRCCQHAISGEKPVHLLLHDVCQIDDAGRRLLRRLAEKGVHLRANGIYNKHVVRECISRVPRPNTSDLRQ